MFLVGRRFLSGIERVETLGSGRPNLFTKECAKLSFLSYSREVAFCKGGESGSVVILRDGGKDSSGKRGGNRTVPTGWRDLFAAKITSPSRLRYFLCHHEEAHRGWKGLAEVPLAQQAGGLGFMR
jgi:hypothetical protein